MKMEKLFDVTGNVSLVTGAGSGLGLAMAEVMADNGARVIMVDINADRLNTIVARMQAANLAVEAAVADVGDASRLREVIDGAAKKHGRLDSVFANAGISAGPGFAMTPKGQIDAIDMALWEKVLRVNLTSVLVTMAAAAAHMKRQGSGRIIVTSSSAGLMAEPLVGYGYVAAKAAITNLVRQAALELAPYNIMVNAICPAAFITNLAGGVMSHDPVAKAKMEERVALHRLAKTEEIKGLALLLASPASSFITGAAIPIDGGLTAG
jgi:NAD(P)-dependent dehydrogenase (short-subunit alcohol dehydrogenase family)